ncbi:MAG TPA: hypothetical protein VGK19_08580 [Capsulimonadaceae bacterium]|jgi:hypothetical protein
MVNIRFFRCLLILMSFIACAANSLAAEALPGLAMHYYGERSFWLHGGSGVAPDLAREIAVNTLRWPPQNWDKSKGPVFYRGGGWSLACRGAITVPADGEYAFAVGDGNSTATVDGVALPVGGSATVRLKKGIVPIAYYWKSNPADKHASEYAKLDLRWKPAGTGDFTPIPPAQLTHVAADVDDSASWRPVISSQGAEVNFNTRRTVTLTIPKAGWYELAAQLSSIPRIFLVSMDNAPLFYVQGERALQQGQAQNVDFLNRARAVRYLTPGRHTATIYGHFGPWFWNDEMPDVMQSIRFGATPIDPRETGSSLAVLPVNALGQPRADMVLRKGEPLVLKVARNTASKEQLTISVKEQRGDSAPVWKQSTPLVGPAKPALAQFSYPSDREGGFEYTVTDGLGRIVDGPWAFVVVDASPAPTAPPGPLAEMPKILVDGVDCTATADTVHQFRDNATSQVIDSPIGRYRVTGTKGFVTYGYIKDPTTKVWRRVKDGEKAEATYWGADWFAYTMHVKHPGKAHMLVAYVPNDVHRLVSVQAFDQITGNYNGWNLEAGYAPESGSFSKLQFLVWPNSPAVDVACICSNGNHSSPLNRQGAVAKYELYELPDSLPLLPSPAGGWENGRECGWAGEQINIGVFNTTTPSIWEGNEPLPGSLPRNVLNGAPYYDWKALLNSWSRYSEDAGYRGDNLSIMPVYTYGMCLMPDIPLLPKGLDIYSTGYRARVVDPYDRDIFKMMLLASERRHVRVVADLMVQRLGEGMLESMAKAEGVSMDGVFVTDQNGKPYRAPTGHMLNPAHPLARNYFLKLLDQIATHYGGYKAFAGIRIRHWAGWPSETDSWYLNDQNGYDDFTVGLFEQQTGFHTGVTSTGDDRFKLRRDRLLQGDIVNKWLDWRCEKAASLLDEGLRVVRGHAPNAKLYSGAVLSGPRSVSTVNRAGGFDPAKLAGRQDIGFGDWQTFNGEGVEWNDPDPIDFANFDVRQPATLHRTLENLQPAGFSYPIGMTVAESYRSYPYELENPALTLAKNKLDMFIYGPAWAIPPVDEGFRRFVQVFRAIPQLPYTQFNGKGADQPAVVAWSATRKRSGKVERVCYLVNRTPKPRTVELVLSGGKPPVSLVDGKALAVVNSRYLVRLDPFMPAVFSAAGSAALVEMHVPASPAELETVRAEVASMDVIAKRAGNTSHTFVQPDPMGDAWERIVATETFAKRWEAIQRAWKGGAVLEAGYLIDRMLADRSWWFEAFGWPTGQMSARQPDGYARNADLLGKVVRQPQVVTVGEVAPFKGSFVVAPSGSLGINFGTSGGVLELRIWGVFGGGYGPISVTVNGKDYGAVGVDGPEAQFAEYVLPVTIPLGRGGTPILLRTSGKNGFAIRAVDLTLLPPTPIRQWSTIGTFDKGSGTGNTKGMEKEFVPEDGAVDLAATYPGIGGKAVAWKQIDIGTDRYVHLLDKYYPRTEGNGVAYLASWVKSPSERDTTLYYAMDWVGKAWVNGAPVLPAISGPWQTFASTTVHLKAGWNMLLVKSSRGTDGWMANAAFGDPGDLVYSPTPPR